MSGPSTTRANCAAVDVLRLPVGLEESVREAEGGREDARVHGDLENDAGQKLSSDNADAPLQTVVTREDITKETPEKSLVDRQGKTGGRNSTGRVTSRFIGGGHKQAYPR